MTNLSTSIQNPLQRMGVWLLSIAFLAMFASSALSHEDKSGPNGGALTDLGSHHLELLLTSSGVKIHVSSSDNSPTDITGATGNAIILAGAKKLISKLTPLESNIMGGDISITDSGPFTVVVIIKLADGTGLQAKFKLTELLAATSHKTNYAKHGAKDNHKQSVQIALNSISDFKPNESVDKVGIVRLWLQIKLEGEEQFIPFTVNVEPKA